MSVPRCTHDRQSEPERAQAAYPPQRCHREVWGETDDEYCVLHSDEPNKPNKAIKEALSDTSGIVTGAKLYGLDDGTDLDFTGVSLPRADFSGSMLEGVSFDGALLEGADFSDTNLKSATFREGAALRHALFDGASCNHTEFQNANLENAAFRDATIVDTELWGIRGTKAIFDAASIRDSRLHQSNLDKATFIDSSIRDSYFTATKLTGGDFAGSRIIDCDFVDAELTDCRFTGTDLDDETTFGRWLLTEYEGDRLAEPECLHRLFEMPQVSERGFGRETDSITCEPPESPFETIPRLNRLGNHLCGTPFRILNRMKTRWRTPTGQDNTLPRQLEALEDATKSYGELKSTYRDGPHGGKARRFNVREREAERKRYFPSPGSLRNSLLKWGMWYGESPGHVVKVGIAIWAFATLAFFLTGIESSTGLIKFSWQGSFQPEVADDILLFSFRRLFTFSNGSYSVSGTGEIVGTTVSAVGKILEAMFVFTLGRRAVS